MSITVTESLVEISFSVSLVSNFGVLIDFVDFFFVSDSGSITPASLRAGGATDILENNVPVANIKYAGRWASERSMAAYLQEAEAARVAREEENRKAAEADRLAEQAQKVKQEALRQARVAEAHELKQNKLEASQEGKDQVSRSLETSAETPGKPEPAKTSTSKSGFPLIPVLVASVVIVGAAIGFSVWKKQK